MKLLAFVFVSLLSLPVTGAVFPDRVLASEECIDNTKLLTNHTVVVAANDALQADIQNYQNKKCDSSDEDLCTIDYSVLPSFMAYMQACNSVGGRVFLHWYLQDCDPVDIMGNTREEDFLYKDKPTCFAPGCDVKQINEYADTVHDTSVGKFNEACTYGEYQPKGSREQCEKDTEDLLFDPDETDLAIASAALGVDLENTMGSFDQYCTIDFFTNKAKCDIDLGKLSALKTYKDTCTRVGGKVHVDTYDMDCYSQADGVDLDMTFKDFTECLAPSCDLSLFQAEDSQLYKVKEMVELSDDLDCSFREVSSGTSTSTTTSSSSSDPSSNTQPTTANYVATTRSGTSSTTPTVTTGNDYDFMTVVLICSILGSLVLSVVLLAIKRRRDSAYYHGVAATPSDLDLEMSRVNHPHQMI